MLAGAGLGNDPALPHPFGQEPLANGVIDLVSSGVVQIFPLKVDLCSTEPLGQLFGKIKRIRPPYVLAQVVLEFLSELPVLSIVIIGPLQFEKHRHQCLRDISASELPKMSLFIG
jgi:hypothetical protein